MKRQKVTSCYLHLLAFIGALLVLISVPLQGAAQPVGQTALQLTAAEKEWLAQHPRIQVGIMDAWPPLNYLDQNKTPQGIGVDYLAAINKRLGNALVPVPAPFKENYDQVLNRQLDALMDITQRPDREKLFNFTRPYIVIPHVFVGRKGGDYFKTEQDLAGKTIALEQGFHNVTYFQKNYPRVTIREYGSTSEALDAVSRGEAEAYAGNRAVVIHLIEKELLNNLRLMGKLTVPKSILQIGVQKEQPLLASILDKALASLTVDEERTIRQKWLQESTSELGLTEAEQAWVKAHPTIRVALNPLWAPVEFLDEHGIPQGISASYLQKIGDLLEIHFDIAKGQDWQDQVEGVKDRNLDIFSSMLRTEEDEAYLGFTESYLSLPIGIFTGQDAQYITSTNELVGKKIAVINGHFVEKILKNNHPDLQLVPASSIITALRKLTHGEVDAVVDSTVTTGYYLSQLGLTNIKLAGEIPSRYELCMGVRSDWPELVQILNKALRTIPESERNEIYGKWTSLRPEQKIDYALISKIVAGALAVVLLFAFWNRRLGREIDIRKQAEAELLAKEAHLEQLLLERTANAAHLREAKECAEALYEEQRAIFESATTGIVLMRDRVIVRCNHKLDEIFGYAPGELSGKSTRVWYPDEAAYKISGKEAYAQMSRGEIHCREQQLTRQDGTLFWARLRGQTLDLSDPSKGAVAMIEDITAEREATEALRTAKERAEAANNKLKDLDRLKSMFIASMSHELRTPLNSIIGFTGMTLQGLSGELNEEQKDNLSRVYQSAKHLLSLITDVIDISKIEAGRIDTYPEKISLPAVVDEAIATIEPQLREKGLALDVDVPDGLLLTTDKKRLLQCLINLLSNGVKFTEKGGIRLAATEQKDSVAIAVTDTGIGIAASDLPKLFEAFERLETHLRVKVGGTGLGLYLTQKIATDLLQGNVSVQSTIGKGSTFTVTVAKDLPPMADS